MKINQMNNEFNAREAALGRDWQTSERLATQEYNTAANQRARLEEAGLNPYLMMSGGSAGTSSSASSGPTASASSPIAQVPMDFSKAGIGIADAINSFYHNKLLLAQAAGQNTQNHYAQIYGNDLNKSIIASNLHGNWDWIDSKFRKSRVDAAAELGAASVEKDKQIVQGIKTENELRIAQTGAAKIGAEGQKIINKYLPQQYETQFMAQAADTYLKFQQGNLTEKQALHETEKIAQTQAATAGLKLSNKLASDLAQYYFEAVKSEYETMAKENKLLGETAEERSRISLQDMKELLEHNKWTNKFHEFNWNNRHLFKALDYAAPVVNSAASLYLIGKNIGRTFTRNPTKIGFLH